MWRADEIEIAIEAQNSGGDVFTIVVTTPAGVLRVMAEVRLASDDCRLVGVHLGGPKALRNELGPANLRLIAEVVRSRFGFPGITIEGAVRTTGANPGRKPRIVRIASRRGDSSP